MIHKTKTIALTSVNGIRRQLIDTSNDAEGAKAVVVLFRQFVFIVRCHSHERQ